MEQTSNPLVDRASHGDQAAIAELLERHLPGLLTYVRLHAGPLLRAKESVGDLANSVCREVLEDMSGFRYQGEGQFRNWLYSTAMSKIVDRQRYYLAQKRTPSREEGLPEGARLSQASTRAAFLSASQVVIGNEDLDRLESVFQQLPEQYRQVITYARILGYTHAEIAREMNKREDTVRVLLHRAVARLGWLIDQQRADGST